ncbi:hypothetical protein Taro_048749 [Colocasia esculenta]|uniref:Uncharacterized protein n=1 Tax=Colocasia esculenta TaxID=4460 RepID=A0A843X904_COLES|nr:hypothetical protein [Colocasia esculenta]
MVDRALVSRDYVPWPKFRSGDSVSLDYVNRRRSQHTESACHGDRKSCLAQREISSTGCRYGCTNIADRAIRLRFGAEKPSFRTLKLRFRSTIAPIPSSVSLDYANSERGQHTESACHGDRKSCSNQREISSTGRRYGCTNIADIVTPSHLFPPLQRKKWA